VSRAGARISGLLAQLSDHAERYRWISTTQAPQGWTAGGHDHAQIYEACRARDSSAAAQALSIHRGRVAVSTIGQVNPGYEPTLVRLALKIISP
jgi:DNA-binding GntR family transcriptional regulator